MGAGYETRLTPAVATLILSGEFDLAERDELDDRLRELEAAGRDVLELDVREVPFIDVVCLRLLDETRQRLAAAGRQLRVTGATPRFRRISRIAGYPDLAGPDLTGPDPAD